MMEYIQVEKLLDEVFVTQGLTGRSERGDHINVLHIIPTSGTMTARQFTEWAMISDDSNPNNYSSGQQKIASTIKSRFLEIFGIGAVDCSRFHELAKSRGGHP
ncbi:hypothetical protein [Pseudoblastomonas halimionae]|uniref:Uncharacterized protein n=1 Tax=Alteriqipengyuania halimionae TaxID=1926630 RepID=A0A6I4TZ80_9SPHN|nr:hypothetical protein [Alteriqipengyuania halimionae]MXP08938.1 hypothetical protein [Alteriqipengyuania halimionae]